MTVTHVGSTKKYAAGWEAIFGGKKSVRAATGSQATAKKSSAKGKVAAKKKATRKK